MSKTQKTSETLGLVNIFNPNLDVVHRGVMSKATISEKGKPDTIQYEIWSSAFSIVSFGSGASIKEAVDDAFGQAKENGNSLLLDVEIFNIYMNELADKWEESNATAGDNQSTNPTQPT